MEEQSPIQEIIIQIPFLGKSSKRLPVNSGARQIKLVASRPSFHVLNITLFSESSKRSISKYFFFEEEQEEFSLPLQNYDSFQLSRNNRGLSYSLKAVFL